MLFCAMSASENRKLTIRLNGREVQNNLRSIRTEVRKLSRAQAQMTIGSNEYNQATREIAKLKGILSDHRKSLNGTSRSWQRIKDTALGFVGGSLITRGLGALGQGLRDLIGISTDFQKAQSGLAAVLQKSTDEISRLTADAKALGATTQFTATQVSNMQTELAKLGFNETEILNATESFLDLASAAGVDVAEAAAVGAATMGAFNLDAAETGRVADVMARSFSSSALDMEKFRESMKSVAPIAKAAGVSIEETTAFLGKLADNGISGSLAGTSLKNIFSELATTGKPVAEAFEDAANQINSAATESEKLALAEDLVGERAKAALLALSSQTDGLSDLTKTLENAGGAAEQMADTQLDNLQGSLTKLESAWQGFILGVEDGDGALNSFLRTVVDSGTSLLGLVTATDSVSDSLIREQTQLNLLVGEITDANIAEEERSAKIAKLQEQYPDFLGNLDAETVSNDQLQSTLSQVNEQYIQRIILQKQSESLQETATRIAEGQLNLDEKRSELINTATKNLIEQSTAGDKAARSALEQLNAISGRTEKIAFIREQLNEGSFEGFFDNRSLDILSAQIDGQEKLIKQGEVALEIKKRQQAALREELGYNQDITEEGTNQSDAEKKAQEEKNRLLEEERKNRAANAQAETDRKALENQQREREKQLLQEIADIEAQIAVERAGRSKDFTNSTIIDLENERQALQGQVDGGRGQDLDAATPLEAATIGNQLDPTLQGLERIAEYKRQLEENGPAELVRKIGPEEAAAVLGAVQEVYAGVSQIASASFNRNEARELEGLEKQNRLKSLSNEEYERKREQIEEKYAKKRRILAVGEALINGALAMTKAAAQNPPPDPRFFIASGLIALNTAAQLATIKKYEQGDLFQDGPLSGPSHKDGGMPVIDPNTGRVRAELEGGEFIVRRRAVTPKTLPLLRAINTGNLPQLDFEKVRPLPSSRFRYEEGDVFEQRAEAQAPQNNNADVIAAIDRLAKAQYDYQRNLGVSVNLTDIEDLQSRRDDAEKIAEVA